MADDQQKNGNGKREEDDDDDDDDDVYDESDDDDDDDVEEETQTPNQDLSLSKLVHLSRSFQEQTDDPSKQDPKKITSKW
eukprot:CAMPEP_0201491350 /NCGR_PEP_ID=MMETSP0151_2-20130828/29509_1 /ASSEMBLY_ACC=CAM_ASM_000257 /TAXON_ID=200890 /ORGANISM="Paramoeba atlantica, Strain 621/1 / CCAP 1560/9" /LENGTH=79 /DNA_ID=CAMNT_0047877663 /DNA_START=72 /DNA_END=308 /DNA_ORIENTATION=+